MPAHDEPEAPRQYLLIIACGDYPSDSDYPSLDLAGEITFLERWLADPQLGRRAFRDLAPELRRNPTEQQINRAFDDFVTRRVVRAYDHLFVYVTGHGETSDREHYLVLTESVAPGRQRRYRTSDIVTKIRDLGVGHAVIIIDTCASADVERRLSDLDRRLPPEYLVVAAAEEAAHVRAMTKALEAFVDSGANDTLSRYLDSTELERACGDWLPKQRVHLYPNVAREESVRRSPCLPNPYFDDAAVVVDAQRIEASFLLPDVTFTGRRRLMTDLVGVARGPFKTTIVAGGAGSGKSAVLRRLAAFSDAGFRAWQARAVREAPPDALPGDGDVDVAAVATGRSSLDLVDQLEHALGVRPLPAASIISRVERLTGLLASRSGTTVVIDAVDESRPPGDLVEEVLKPLAGSGRVRLILGVRGPAPAERTDEPTLVDSIAATLDADVIAVDAPPYWAAEDLIDCADTLLQTAAVERGADPPDSSTSRQLATRIASESGKSFLLATLLASDPAADVAPARAGDALDVAAVLARVITAELESAFNPKDRERAVTLLQAAAISLGPGIPPRRIWPRIATAIAGGDLDYGTADVTWLLRQRVGGYLTRDKDGEDTVYRPYHAELGAALFRLPLAAADPTPGVAELHGHVFDELKTLAIERVTGDVAIPPDWYIARYLAQHAETAGRLDDALTDPHALAASDPQRLLTLLGQARSDLARDLAAVYRGSAPALAGRTCGERASILEITARQQGRPRAADLLAAAFPGRPWDTGWARWTSAPQHLVLADDLTGIAGLTVLRRPPGVVIFVAESGGTVRAIDAETGRVLWRTRIDAPQYLCAAADVVAVGTPSEILIVDADTGSSRQVVPWTGGSLHAIGLSPDASLLAAGSYPEIDQAKPGIAYVWQRPAGGPGFAPLWSAPAFVSGILSLSWRSSGEHQRFELVVGGDPIGQPETDRNLARVYDGVSGTLIASLPASSTLPAFSRASPSGRIVTVQTSRDLIWWKSDNSGPERQTANSLRSGTLMWDFDDRPGGEAVIGADDEGISRIEMSGDPRPDVLLYDAHLQALAVADGLLITASETGVLTRWDLRQISGSVSRRVRIDRAWASGAGSLIFSTSRIEPGAVRIQDAATGAEVGRGSLAISGVQAVAVLDEHDLLLVGDSSGQVHGRRSSAVDEELFCWPIHERRSGRCRVNGIAVHEDLLVTAGDDGTVRFTDWRTGRQTLPPVTHHGWTDKPMLAAAIVAEPDGDLGILAGNSSGILLYWRLSSLSSAASRHTALPDGFSTARTMQVTEMDDERDLSSMTWLRQRGGRGQLAVPAGAGHIDILDIADRASYRWKAYDGNVTALCESGRLLYTADYRGLIRCWAGVAEGRPHLKGELPTGLATTALLPLATGYVAVVSAGGLATVRCQAR